MTPERYAKLQAHAKAGAHAVATLADVDELRVALAHAEQEVMLARAEMLRESADMLDVLVDEGCLEASLRCEARLARELAADIESKVAVAKGSEPR